MFRGSITALVTPFDGGKLDETKFKSFVEWQINEGSHGLVPCGTTGESPVLSHEEHIRVINICIDVASKRVPIIAGTGSNSTEEAIYLTKSAKEAGADGALVVTPYYNKPSQRGLVSHYLKIADSVDIPLIIYNIPGRSVVDLTLESLKTLSNHSNIVGIKDASDNLARTLSIRLELKENFSLLSGDDVTATGFLAQGGNGCVSVCSNVAPRLNAKLYDLWDAGKYDEVWKIRDILHPLNVALFCEPNPAPIKYACSLLNKCSPETRPPMVPIDSHTKERIKNCMKVAGIID
ncbi:MAG: 4-hydroxy-tetrahydrodipicolinate synthase [Pseudomonadota bacterium]|nr:4-hydroxy-tetrahydrodipicolinate synthase [Pseudomonadota bacterium]